MQEFDYEILEKEEKVLAKVLLKNKLITADAFGKFLDFKKVHDWEGKEFLGTILLKLKYIDQKDINEFVQEQQKPHLQLCESLVNDGYMLPAQFEKIKKLSEEEGREVISVINELNIMTKDNFVKIYNKKMSGLRLGEWLEIKGKISKEQIKKARQIQKINRLSEFLVQNGYCSEKVIKKVKDKISLVG